MASSDEVLCIWFSLGHSMTNVAANIDMIFGLLVPPPSAPTPVKALWTPLGAMGSRLIKAVIMHCTVSIYVVSSEVCLGEFLLNVIGQPAMDGQAELACMARTLWGIKTHQNTFLHNFSKCCRILIEIG